MHREKRILVLGGTGFLGSYFINLLGKRAIAHTTQAVYLETGINFQSATFRKNEEDKIKHFLETQNCGTIVNCTALADVEKCESNPGLAYWMNCELPGILSTISMSLDSKFVHISTDAVFEGATSFYTETDRPSPLSVYGKSKWMGEQLVLEKNPQSLVARVNFFGNSVKKRSLFNFFYENLILEKTISGYADVYFTPLYAADLVEVIMELLEINTSGIFHVVGNERISKFEFGVLIAEVFDLPTNNIKKGTIMGEEGVAFRPLDTSLANDKIKSLGINLPSVRGGLFNLSQSMR